jgi:hypothetical protein
MVSRNYVVVGLSMTTKEYEKLKRSMQRDGERKLKAVYINAVDVVPWEIL